MLTAGKNGVEFRQDQGFILSADSIHLPALVTGLLLPVPSQRRKDRRGPRVSKGQERPSRVISFSALGSVVR